MASLPNTQIELIPENLNNLRCDQACSQIFSQYSRSQIQKWLENGDLLVNSMPYKAKQKVKVGDKISLTPNISPQVESIAEAIPLNIVYEDDDILLINKPVGLVMHPAAGNWHGTLLNALLHYLPAQGNIARAGIVHRLDKDTSGILVVAKTLEAQASLVSQLQDRSLGRTYQALVWGKPELTGKIDLPIGRSEKDRKKQAVTTKGKNALTYFKRLKTWEFVSLVECNLATGRTHQIRVHFAHLKMPLVGDKTYGRSKINKQIDRNLANLLQNFPRQALHAKSLHLIHPRTKQSMEFSTELAADFTALLTNIDNLYKTIKTD